MILHTTEIRLLSDYRLFVRFNNGESGEVDLADELDGYLSDALTLNTYIENGPNSHAS